ncbi:hypothetical protein WMY93_022783 [Mugilogobius chulae]|uniref:Uncharacterized protein n=1 Tax=Mugilogobius chulae TaxID=88201 RepID=A0AAW0NEZ2_9GOBI
MVGQESLAPASIGHSGSAPGIFNSELVRALCPWRVREEGIPVCVLFMILRSNATPQPHRALIRERPECEGNVLLTERTARGEGFSRGGPAPRATHDSLQLV